MDRREKEGKKRKRTKACVQGWLFGGGGRFYADRQLGVFLGVPRKTDSFVAHTQPSSSSVRVYVHLPKERHPEKLNERREKSIDRQIDIEGLLY